MGKEELIQKLIRFKDKAYCTYTHQQASHIWYEICSELEKYDVPSKITSQIGTEWGHVQLGHGLHQCCAALDSEIKKCIQFLKEGNKEDAI